MDLKKYIKYSVYLLFFIMLLSACDAQTPLLTLDRVQLRIHNSSPYIMDSLKVSFPKEEVMYGPIPHGWKTEFKEVEEAYRYAYDR